MAACAATWGIVGLTVLPRFDLGGAIGVSVFLFFLWKGRVPVVYGGVFFIVLFLELWGTAVGLWQWHAITPGLRLPMGNPPSGAMSGYVLFDIVAIAVTARLLRSRAAVRRGQAPAALAANPHRPADLARVGELVPQEPLGQTPGGRSPRDGEGQPREAVERELLADHDAEIIGASSRSIRAPYGSRSACLPARTSKTASAASFELSSAS